MASLCLGGDRKGFDFANANLGVAANWWNEEGRLSSFGFGVENCAGDGFVTGGGSGRRGVGMLWKRRLEEGFGVAVSFGGLRVMNRRGDGV